MRLVLDPEWRKIIKKAWSMRFMVLAGVLTSLEFLLPYFSDALPRGSFAALSAITITAAMIARVTAQKDFPNG